MEYIHALKEPQRVLFYKCTLYNENNQPKKGCFILNKEFYVLENNDSKMYYKIDFLLTDDIDKAKKYTKLHLAEKDIQNHQLNDAIPKKVKAQYFISNIQKKMHCDNCEREFENYEDVVFAEGVLFCKTCISCE